MIARRVFACTLIPLLGIDRYYIGFKNCISGIGNHHHFSNFTRNLLLERTNNATKLRSSSPMLSSSAPRNAMSLITRTVDDPDGSVQE